MPAHNPKASQAGLTLGGESRRGVGLGFSPSLNARPLAPRARAHPWAAPPAPAAAPQARHLPGARTRPGPQPCGPGGSRRPSTFRGANARHGPYQNQDVLRTWTHMLSKAFTFRELNSNARHNCNKHVKSICNKKVQLRPTPACRLQDLKQANAAMVRKKKASLGGLAKLLSFAGPDSLSLVPPIASG